MVDECLGLSDYSPVVAGDFGRELVDIILDLGFGKRALTMPYSSAVAASMTTDPRISSSARATDEGGKASDRAAAGDDSTTDLWLIDGRTFQTRESEIARQRELVPTPRLAPRIRAIETAGNRLKRVVRSSHGGSRLGPDHWASRRHTKMGVLTGLWGVSATVLHRAEHPALRVV